MGTFWRALSGRGSPQCHACRLPWSLFNCFNSGGYWCHFSLENQHRICQKELALKTYLWQSCFQVNSQKFLRAPQHVLFWKSRVRHICSGPEVSAHPSPRRRDSHAAALLLEVCDFFPSPLPSPEDGLTCSCLFLGHHSHLHVGNIF